MPPAVDEFDKILKRLGSQKADYDSQKASGTSSPTGYGRDEFIRDRTAIGRGQNAAEDFDAILRGDIPGSRNEAVGIGDFESKQFNEGSNSTSSTAKDLDSQKVGTTGGGEQGTGTFNIGEFEQLLERLEASKGRQQRQKSIEGRRDIFQQGLAGMMSNF